MSSASLRSMRIALGAACLALLGGNLHLVAQEPDLGAAIARIKQVDRFGAGHAEATAAVAELSRQPASRIPEMLRGFAGTNPLSANWLRAAIEASAERDPSGLPVETLTSLLQDRTQDSRARSVAFDLIVAARPDSKETWIESFLDDPCLELRFMAIDRGMKRAAAAVSAQKNEEALAEYQRLLENARNPEQINAIADSLDKLGQPVDLTAHYGFLTTWSLIGPFDNREKIGFDAVYAPEQDINVMGVYQGKEGEVRWQEHTTTAAAGVLDLNTAIAKHMGAVAYATTTFTLSEPTTVSVRLGTPNGHKVWVDGQLVISNHVYHAGNSIDQHQADLQLEAGEHTLLVKICQNEQTDSWAQDWSFQLRLADPTGKGLQLGR